MIINVMNIINSISEFHRLLSLKPPLHPLVSVIHLEEVTFRQDGIWEQFFLNFYCISLKRDVRGKIKYGQQYYDFNKGIMSFTAPRQVQSLDVVNVKPGTGYLLVFHPDLLSNYPLSTTIKTYGFFAYAVSEALHLSEKEEQDIITILDKMDDEYRHIDRHTQDIVVSQVDLLLNYANRFYERQFITRKKNAHDLLARFDAVLTDYVESGKTSASGLPTVHFLAETLHLSPNYLSDMLRVLTGQNTQQHIQDKLIEKAKELLVTTSLSVAEIAYQLGFEYPQSLNKLFKNKTNLSPLEYRQSFN
jgi:AraC-type DNA-binding domain-containing proteins